MKNVMNNSKKVLLMVALFATVIGYANDNLFTINKSVANKTVLTLDNVKQGNLFTIKDKNGIVLYKESIQKEGTYKKEFDLTSLPDGTYLFELDKDMEINIIPFTVILNEVSFDKSSSEVIFKPATRVKDGMVFINRLSLSKQVPLEVSIYFDSGIISNDYELIYNENLTSDDNFVGKVFKIEDYKEGNYKIVYKTEGRTFVEFI